MKTVFQGIVIAIAAGCLLAPSTRAQEEVEEPSTDRRFPAEITFESGGRTHTLRVTGLSVRKKFFVKVYGIAHYMDVAGFETEEAALAAAMSDEHAKQITMVFVRDVEAKKIRDAFREGLEKNASAGEFAEISDLVDTFTGYYERDVIAGRRYVLRWLPGGVVQSMIQGAENPKITSAVFARVLWRIWLGGDSIVDRDRLLEMAVKN